MLIEKAVYFHNLSIGLLTNRAIREQVRAWFDKDSIQLGLLVTRTRARTQKSVH